MVTCTHPFRPSLTVMCALSLNSFSIVYLSSNTNNKTNELMVILQVPGRKVFGRTFDYYDHAYDNPWPV